jgi:hypothetical protein
MSKSKLSCHVVVWQGLLIFRHFYFLNNPYSTISYMPKECGILGQGTPQTVLATECLGASAWKGSVPPLLNETLLATECLGAEGHHIFSHLSGIQHWNQSWT